jgi:nucleotide-binding universal stress UspA family protein
MNTSKKIILVPTDFSEQSKIALQHAIDIAKKTGGEVHLLHVMEESGILENLFSSDDNDKKDQELWKKLTMLTDEFDASTRNITTTLLAKGKIEEEIVKVSELVGANIIVMGTSGAETFAKRLVGSNAIKVIRESRIPVITLKGIPKRENYETIVLPLDLTKETREKVSKAINLARKFDAEIKVVSILLSDDEDVKMRLKTLLNQVTTFIAGAGIKCTSDFKIAKNEELGEEVIKYAIEVDADLIMIMTQQETNFKERFIGSAAQEIINNAEIPVCSIIPTLKKDLTVFHPY